MRLELDDEGLQFGNFFTRAVDIEFSFGDVFLVMILAAFCHILLMIYIDQLFPGEFGVAKKWYFPLDSCIKLFKKRNDENNVDESSLNSEILSAQVSSDCFEEEPVCIKVGIQISNLSKTFGIKTAVKKLNMNMYEGQITSLLGHNGAGKTTTIKVLTGMIAPTTGTAFIDGKDIRYRIDEARNSIGFCPQHNVLFDELSVEDHFKFFCRLKGIDNETEIQRETNKYISILEMEEQRKTLSHVLSGGFKRKLSIGIALCGNSKIVICDEPTSGMDAQARRGLWDLLIEEKKRRTILLTTRKKFQFIFVLKISFFNFRLHG